MTEQEIRKLIKETNNCLFCPNYDRNTEIIGKKDHIIHVKCKKGYFKFDCKIPTEELAKMTKTKRCKYFKENNSDIEKCSTNYEKSDKFNRPFLLNS